MGKSVQGPKTIFTPHSYGYQYTGSQNNIYSSQSWIPVYRVPKQYLLFIVMETIVQGLKITFTPHSYGYQCTGSQNNIYSSQLWIPVYRVPKQYLLLIVMDTSV